MISPDNEYNLCVDLSKHSVHNHSEMEDLITLGNTNRMTASTGINKSSSRSHAIFTIGFKQVKYLLFSVSCRLFELR